ncbi:FAD:protein FMN transferase ApbE [Phragmitibacter flavus]|uniref:FAD:protein FMN transferase n=1 Tax=Phragmitibacter flavus TaxID=2576071 RepID=A0A5R8KDT7_9BACT|nr:FAD:protein FMN transferase [Phragmitibacter flavus]TLD70417.1 FAD:protein FMN transferase ApbE [Phragmitibacter flavus]
MDLTNQRDTGFQPVGETGILPVIPNVSTPPTRSITGYKPASLLLLLLTLVLTTCQPATQLHTLGGPTMGTTWTLKIFTDHPANVQDLIQSRLDELESIFSTWRTDSAITNFNQSPSTDWIPVPQELADLAQQSQHFSQITDGAYDITIPPLLTLWGFGPDKKPRQIPSATDIIAAKAHVDWQKLHIQTTPPALRKSDPALRIDLSSLVEGYALDHLATRLQQTGHQHFLLEIGGEIIASGLSAKNTPWTVGIQTPGPDRTAIASTTPLQNEAIATAGVYQQYWEQNGQRHSHLINARTGRPITHPLSSVTVKAKSALQADAWATILLILGPQKGPALASKHSISALFLEQTIPPSPQFLDSQPSLKQ